MDIRYMSLLVLSFIAPIFLYYFIAAVGELVGRINFNPNKRYLGTELGDWIGLGQGYLGVLLIVIFAWKEMFI